MKIGLISFHTFSQPGGVKNHILGLYDEFKKRGLYVKIIAPRRSGREKYPKDVILLGTSIPLKIAGTQSDLGINFNPFAINKLFKKEKFDVLHFHNFGFPSGIQILERSKSLNVLTFHANIEKNKLFKIFPFILKAFNKEVREEIDGIIGVNPLNLKVFKDYKGPKTVIPNGIDLNKFKPEGSRIKKYLDGRINILFLGRIEERKGLIYLLKSYKILDKKYDNIRLIIVGEGPSEQECLKFINKNKLRNVVFERHIKEEDVPSYYRTCDIYCSPAIYGESFGIVLVEAMATGKPVVAFANSGYKIVLNRGKGKRFLAEPKDYRTLSKKIEELIRSKKLRSEIGRWGIEESKKYSWPKIADQVLAFYEFCRRSARH
ncbi:MAG: glycosyltransferase family 4 protein [bacterium]|nr:glycosyltransferase family 4 protein [bacterium]